MLRHVLQQGPTIAALARTALARRGAAAPQLPGAWLEATLPPRSPALVRDFIRNVGGDPATYRGRLPPTMFPQWGFALAARTLAGIPYPLTKVMNAGCRLEVRGPIADDEPLRVRARLDSIDDDGRRAILTQRVVTNDALVAEMRVFVPLAKTDKKKPPATVPPDAREIAFFPVGANAGLDFAELTGDFNPIHWLPAYARAAGFRGCILHGFATLARAVEALNRRAVTWSTLDVRFTGPLLLPARVGVYVGPQGALWVGDAPGGRSYLEGHHA